MFKSILIWGSLICLVLFILFISIINILAHRLNSPDYAIKAYFNNLKMPYQINRINFDSTTTLRYIKTGAKKQEAPLLFFIHGAPGTWGAFKGFLADYDLNKSYKMISMDRIGYGGSDFGNSETNISVHAEAAAQIIRKHPSSKVIIIGHSYGAPIAGKLAVDYPELVDGIIMVAPLNDPKSEPMPIYSKIANLKISRWLLPKFINVASDEKQYHSLSLKAIESDWENLTVPTMHIHGKKDGLAPFDENIRFSKKHIPADLLILKEEESMGHMIPWMNAAFLKNQILYFTSSIK